MYRYIYILYIYIYIYVPLIAPFFQYTQNHASSLLVKCMHKASCPSSCFKTLEYEPRRRLPKQLG